jgi:hypothetical protein
VASACALRNESVAKRRFVYVSGDAAVVKKDTPLAGRDKSCRQFALIGLAGKLDLSPCVYVHTHQKLFPSLSGENENIHPKHLSRPCLPIAARCSILQHQFFCALLLFAQSCQAYIGNCGRKSRWQHKMVQIKTLESYL